MGPEAPVRDEPGEKLLKALRLRRVGIFMRFKVFAVAAETGKGSGTAEAKAASVKPY